MEKELKDHAFGQVNRHMVEARLAPSQRCLRALVFGDLSLQLSINPSQFDRCFVLR